MIMMVVEKHPEILSTQGIYRNQGDISPVENAAVDYRISNEGKVSWTTYDPGVTERIWSVATDGIVPHADRYPEFIQIHISLSQGFVPSPSSLFSEQLLLETSETIGGLSASQTYYLQIIPTDFFGNQSETNTELVFPKLEIFGLERGPKLSPSKFIAVVGERVQFDASRSLDPSGLDIFNYTYDFGDSAPLLTTTLNKTSHIYDITGTFVLDLILLNSNLDEIPIVIPPSIIIKENIVVILNDETTEIKVNEFFTADASSSYTIIGNIRRSIWNFDDSENSTTANPNEAGGLIALHRFDATGIYSISCSITDELAGRTISETLDITVIE